MVPPPISSGPEHPPGKLCSPSAMVNHGYDNGSSSSSVLAALARAHLFAAPRRLTAESIAETADLSIFARNGDLHSMDMVMANFGVQRYDVGEMSA
mmetsp:Transcript_72799/g.229326  ORF Transcript_72799/g.229326 Transcript_72799/m.229326 type:complete len:96 (-) Transcript_72799:2549-2836(-)